MIIEAPINEMYRRAANWITPDEGRILQISCGRGEFAHLLKERHIGNYIGIDPREKKLKRAKINHINSGFRFLPTDIRENFHYFSKVSMVIAFDYFQLMKDDLILINNIKPETKIIFSLPNYEYQGYKRWYESDGWEERYTSFIRFHKILTFQNPKKEFKRTFLFKGTRTDYVDENNLQLFEHVTFDSLSKRTKGL